MRKTIKNISFVLGGLLLLFFSFVLSSFYTHPDYLSHAFLKSEQKPTANKEIECKEFNEKSPLLNDRYRDYIWNSAYQKFGEIIKTKDQIKTYYLQQKLQLVDSSEFYLVDSLFYSYAFLTPPAKKLLDDIGEAFQQKIKHTTLSNSRIVVTSLLRTEHTVKRLRKRNRNSLRISSHLHGTTFDLAHNEFSAKRTLDSSEVSYLKEILAETLTEFRSKKRCFVTYETRQACFHIVNRDDSKLPH
jgi:hypothetical protein